MGLSRVYSSVTKRIGSVARKLTGRACEFNSCGAAAKAEVDFDGAFNIHDYVSLDPEDLYSPDNVSRLKACAENDEGARNDLRRDYFIREQMKVVKAALERLSKAPAFQAAVKQACALTKKRNSYRAKFGISPLHSDKINICLTTGGKGSSAESFFNQINFNIDNIISSKPYTDQGGVYEESLEGVICHEMFHMADPWCLPGRSVDLLQGHLIEAYDRFKYDLLEGEKRPDLQWLNEALGYGVEDPQFEEKFLIDPVRFADRDVASYFSQLRDALVKMPDYARSRGVDVRQSDFNGLMQAFDNYAAEPVRSKEARRIFEESYAIEETNKVMGEYFGVPARRFHETETNSVPLGDDGRYDDPNVVLQLLERRSHDGLREGAALADTVGYEQDGSYRGSWLDFYDRNPHLKPEVSPFDNVLYSLGNRDQYFAVQRVAKPTVTMT